MLPKVIVYNSVSVDGAIKDFDIDVGLHYQVLNRMGADALLAGSATAKSGIELFNKTVPPEELSDFAKPKAEPGDERLIWVVADSRAILKGLLHVHRRSGYARDIVVLVSTETADEYLDYLQERHYDFIVAGDDHVDYRAALEELNKRYGIKTVITDSGGVLASVLLESGLVDEVQLLVAPEIVGKKAIHLFRMLKGNMKLQLIRQETIAGNHVLLVYRCTNKLDRLIP